MVGSGRRRIGAEGEQGGRSSLLTPIGGVAGSQQAMRLFELLSPDTITAVPPVRGAKPAPERLVWPAAASQGSMPGSLRSERRARMPQRPGRHLAAAAAA